MTSGYYWRLARRMLAIVVPPQRIGLEALRFRASSASPHPALSLSFLIFRKAIAEIMNSAARCRRSIVRHVICPLGSTPMTLQRLRDYNRRIT